MQDYEREFMLDRFCVALLVIFAATVLILWIAGIWAEDGKLVLTGFVMLVPTIVTAIVTAARYDVL